jgi:hypothetical protein
MIAGQVEGCEVGVPLGVNVISVENYLPYGHLPKHSGDDCEARCLPWELHDCCFNILVQESQAGGISVGWWLVCCATQS